MHDDFAIATVDQDAPEYPLLLRGIRSAPKQLYVLGDPHILSAALTIAVVGTRNISDYGAQVLRHLIPPLVRSGAIIVSGLAFGIDGLAHEIALDHGGHCLAVLANGLDEIYPREHDELASRILTGGGAVISEQPLGTPPLRQYFPARNRIISGLAMATIIVEAQPESGSLITAKFALDQDRAVFAVPGSIFTDNQLGTNELIAAGVTPLLSAEQVLEQLNLSPVEIMAAQSQLDFGSSEEKTIYDCLKDPLSLDELSLSSQMSPVMLNQQLSLMELKGLVKNMGGMRYLRR